MVGIFVVKPLPCPVRASYLFCLTLMFIIKPLMLLAGYGLAAFYICDVNQVSIRNLMLLSLQTHFLSAILSDYSSLLRTADEVEWNVSWAQPSAAHVCPMTAKHKHAIPHSAQKGSLGYWKRFPLCLPCWVVRRNSLFCKFCCTFHLTIVPYSKLYIMLTAWESGGKPVCITITTNMHVAMRTRMFNFFMLLQT